MDLLSHSPFRLPLWLLDTGTFFPHPTTYSLKSFKTCTHWYLQLQPNPWNFFFFSRYKEGSTEDFRGCTFWGQLLLVSILLEKKNIRMVVSNIIKKIIHAASDLIVDHLPCFDLMRNFNASTYQYLSFIFKLNYV